MSETAQSVWQEVEVRCQHLRSKQYHMALDFHPSGMDEGFPVPCWCLKTMQCFGPDYDEASESACTAERACFDPDI